MKKVTIPCSCGCSVVSIIEFEEWKDDPRSFYAEFYTMVRPRFRDRFKTAWAVFRGREHWLHDVCMQAEGLEELRDYLNEIAPLK